jgi:hypothetical protein
VFHTAVDWKQKETLLAGAVLSVLSIFATRTCNHKQRHQPNDQSDDNNLSGAVRNIARVWCLCGAAAQVNIVNEDKL